jgi:hypothetical protein
MIYLFATSSTILLEADLMSPAYSMVSFPSNPSMVSFPIIGLITLSFRSPTNISYAAVPIRVFKFYTVSFFVDPTENILDSFK